MTPSTLLSPLLTYCADLPGFSPNAIEVAETEQRIGTMLSTLHHWERSAVEWRERAEGLHARVAELEREIEAKRELIVTAAKETRRRIDEQSKNSMNTFEQMYKIAKVQLSNALHERDEYRRMAECAAIMAVCGYFSRMRGPDAVYEHRQRQDSFSGMGRRCCC